MVSARQLEIIEGGGRDCWFCEGRDVFLFFPGFFSPSILSLVSKMPKKGQAPFEEKRSSLRQVLNAENQNKQGWKKKAQKNLMNQPKKNLTHLAAA